MAHSVQESEPTIEEILSELECSEYELYNLLIAAAYKLRIKLLNDDKQKEIHG